MTHHMDEIIDEKIALLQEEKYRLRMFKTILLIKVDTKYGVEETLQAIRAISGVTVVSAIDSFFRTHESVWMTRVKIKFHPKKDSTTADTYLNDQLLPAIRGREIPGGKVIRVLSAPREILK